MSLVDKLRKLRIVPQSIWIQFTGAYIEKSSDLYLFFEGHADVSYYTHVFRKAWNDGKIFGFKCGGKSEVLRLIPTIQGRLGTNRWRGIFFVDRDFETFFPEHAVDNDQLYKTDWYSIENHIVSKESAKIFMTDIMKVPANEPALDQVLDEYENAYSTFVNAISPIMAWVIAARRAGLEVTFEELKLDSVLTIDPNCSCSLSNNWGTLLFSYFGKSGVQVLDSDVDAVSVEFKNHNAKKYIRGKFELWFFVNFLKKCHSQLSQRKEGEQRYSCSISICNDSLMDLLPPRLPIASSLQEFVYRVLQLSPIIEAI